MQLQMATVYCDVAMSGLRRRSHMTQCAQADGSRIHILCSALLDDGVTQK